MTDKNNGGAGWRCLGQVRSAPHPLFGHLWFLEGYDFSCNIYVLAGPYLTVIDPGNDYTAYMQLFALDFRPADVRKVVITHGHFDHAMGVIELLRAYPSLAQPGPLEVIMHAAGPGELKDILREMGALVTEVRGGETLKLSGFDFEVVPTPGHTVDGVCLYHAASGTVFTGDTVLPDAVAAPDPAAGGRLEDYLAGLKNLLKRKICHVLPGHGLPVMDDGARTVRETYEAVILKIVGPRLTWFEAALRFLQIGYLEDALFCCEKWLEAYPEEPRGSELKGMCLNDLGRFQEAERVFDGILSRESGRLGALLGKGYALMGQERYLESLPYFDAALEVEPRLREAQVYKGLALYLSGRVDEAMDIEVFREEFAERVKAGLLQQAGKPENTGAG
jgi:glyoxylase-like metal-dependent hydrolase (beta-lactamase superfamily II)